WGKREGHELFLGPKDGSLMVKVPAGKVRRGTPDAERKALVDRWGMAAALFDDEKSPKDATVDEFLIDVYEVSNADYALFLLWLGSEPKEKQHRFCSPDEPKEKDH